MDEGFSVKEVVTEIKEDLKDFRGTYDTDQQRRDIELSKRPTRSELYSIFGVISAAFGAALAMGL